MTQRIAVYSNDIIYICEIEEEDVDSKSSHSSSLVENWITFLPYERQYLLKLLSDTLGHKFKYFIQKRRWGCLAIKSSRIGYSNDPLLEHLHYVLERNAHYSYQYLPREKIFRIWSYRTLPQGINTQQLLIHQILHIRYWRVNECLEKRLPREISDVILGFLFGVPSFKNPINLRIPFSEYLGKECQYNITPR
jgi:hypothetical protein